MVAASSSSAALATASRMMICSVLSAAFQFADVCVPYVFSPAHISWIFVTSIVVASAAGDCLGQAIAKSLDRVLGTLLGGLTGAVLLTVIHAMSSEVPLWLARCFVLVSVTLATGISFYSATASSSKWVKTHQYALFLFPITTGMVVLIPVGGQEVASFRFFEIFLGCIVAMVALLVSHPGSTIYVVHKGLGNTAIQVAELVDRVCAARINRRSLKTLREHFEADFHDDEDVRQAYRSVAEMTTKLRSLLPYASWEPRCLRASALRGLPPRATLRYRLVIGRLTRLNATAMALDSQLRAFQDLPALSAGIADAAQSLTDQVAVLLREAGSRLSGRLAAQRSDSVNGNDEKLLAGVRAGMKGLSEAVQGIALEDPTDEGKLEPYVISMLGPAAESSYIALSASAFVFLALQLSLQAMMFFDDAMKLLGSEGAPQSASEVNDEESEETPGSSTEDEEEVVPV
jgi:hypothetical protein